MKISKISFLKFINKWGYVEHEIFCDFLYNYKDINFLQNDLIQKSFEVNE
jgi:hypothetical protein